MSDSELYYGQVQEIGRDEAGTITSLLLTSERYGEYVMNISGETVWIDSGERTASDPATLQVGESVYVYHSPVSTRSLPPQSPAFAVVRNVPQDVGAAKYLEVEAVTQNEDGSATITTAAAARADKAAAGSANGSKADGESSSGSGAGGDLFYFNFIRRTVDVDDEFTHEYILLMIL